MPVNKSENLFCHKHLICEKEILVIWEATQIQKEKKLKIIFLEEGK